MKQVIYTSLAHRPDGAPLPCPLIRTRKIYLKQLLHSVERLRYVENPNYNFKQHLLYHIFVYIYYLNIAVMMNFKFILRLKNTSIYFVGVFLMNVYPCFYLVAIAVHQVNLSNNSESFLSRMYKNGHRGEIANLFFIETVIYRKIFR